MSRLCVLYFYFQNTFYIPSIWFRDAFEMVSRCFLDVLYENEMIIPIKHKKGSTNCEASFVMCYV